MRCHVARNPGDLGLYLREGGCGTLIAMTRILAALLVLALLPAGTIQPARAASAAGADATAPAARAAANLTLTDGIAPGVNRTTSGFGTATVIVPSGYYVTYLVKSDPSLAGKPIEIWTRSATSDWALLTTRVADANGAVHQFARVTASTGFRAKFAGDPGATAAASHGRVATISGTTFALEVIPATAPPRFAIGGQQFLYLVRLHDSQASRGLVSLAVSAPGAASVSHSAIAWRYAVNEVTVVPYPVNEGSKPVSLRVVITATRGAERTSVTRTLQVRAGTDTIADEARAHLDLFLPWLENEFPSFHLGPSTPMTGTINRNVPVVDHYLFLTHYWEIDLSWHGVVPPDDWARIQLRNRGSKVPWPIRAYQVDSVTGHTTPHAITPALEVER